MKTTDAYCATTVSAAYIRAGIAAYTGTECGVENYTLVAKARGIWVEDDAHVPGIGDACVYDWDDNGVGDCVGAGDHIGIVTASDGQTFTVTEGNMSGGVVGTRKMKVNGRYIRGFICPDFAAIAAELSGKNESEEIENMSKAYASTAALNGECVDPRFSYVTRGCAEYVEWLGQKENPNGNGWATGAGYGEKILSILKAILAITFEKKARKRREVVVKWGHGIY